MKQKQLTLIELENRSEPGQIFHTFDKWECFKAGFYEAKPSDRSDFQLRTSYLLVLGSESVFRNAIRKVFSLWPRSCEHYLTNQGFNRIAWIGQAAVCIETAVPSQYCGGWRLLSEEQQLAADNIALEFLNVWLAEHGRNPVTMKKAKGR